MLAKLLYSHSRYLWLTVIVILMVGAASMRSLGRQEDPTITNFVASVTTFFPGAEPARIEALVSKPLERELRAISEVDEVKSTSSTGVSSIVIELYDTLEPSAIERAWSEVRDAVDDASRQFPAGVAAPVFDNERTTAYVRIIALTSAPGYEISLPLLSRSAEDLAERARNFFGTQFVDVYGEASEEIRVDVNEQSLLARGISMVELTQALRGADPRRASGRASGDVNDLLIEIDGEFDSAARVANVIIRTDSNANSVSVGDIARVYRAQQTPPMALAHTDGRRGILLGVAMNEGQQVDNWSREFEVFLDDYRAQAPSGIEISTSYNQATYTEARLQEVLSNLAIGVALVLIVLLFTLGLRAATVVAVILPLCTLVSLVVMNQIGLPIHQMSVTGLVVALGLLVDGSIVMTDEVRKRLLAKEPPLDAIGESVHRMRVPLLSSTATTILAFVPMVILPGPAGDFLGSIAKAVVIMLGSSLVLALVITPVLAARLLPGGLNKGSHWWEAGLSSGAIGRTLSRALDWSIRHPGGSVALALALPLTGFLAFPTLTAQFFPGTDRDQLSLKVTLPPGRSITDTYGLVKELDERLRGEPLIRRVDWTVGESSPQFYYNIVRNREGIPSYAQAMVLTRDENQTDDLIRRLQTELDAEYPQARIVVLGIEQGPPVAAPLEIDVLGPDLETLRQLGEEFRLRMERVPDITHSNTGLVAGAPKLVFKLDEQRVRMAGLDLATVAETLDAALRGRVGGEILEGTQRLPVRARLNEADWADPEQIASIRLPLPSSDGDSRTLQSISLSTLGRFSLEPANSPITRRDGERINTVQGFVTRGVLAEGALKDLQTILEEDPVVLPFGYRYQFGGNSDARASVVQNIIAPMGLIVAALLATIVLTFNSWRLSAVAFSVFVLSMGLSLLSLAIFRYPFGVQALIGVIGSIGVSINAAIIILTALQLDTRAARGEPDAVRAVVMDSSRHIVSTTITTFGGFLPLILEGSQFWPPFAMAIAGGVLLSTVVSFFYIPPMFILCYRRKHRRLQAEQHPTLLDSERIQAMSNVA
ncbi:efflux RND transporter permease subunit [Congregibacter brevis]|uniref:Efflux RND transporter permease subunit n=1 Tax=Congregibacter brevis TaxID=3081201 RepID=A0ABZ0IAF9_9GAMM|nr:efflux RND transporter permease subunit [Congregibacter sp. IMCC45268]